MKFTVSIIALYAAAAFARVTEPTEDIEPFEDAEPVEDMDPFEDADPFEDEDLFDDFEPFNSTSFEDGEDPENIFGLEKRRGCTGHRKTTDVCQGNFVARMSSRHNCYNRDGRCCARNKNRDGGITISNSNKHGEDCKYCFTGRCKGGA